MQVLNTRHLLPGFQSTTEETNSIVSEKSLAFCLRHERKQPRALYLMYSFIIARLESLFRTTIGPGYRPQSDSCRYVQKCTKIYRTARYQIDKVQTLRSPPSNHSLSVSFSSAHSKRHPMAGPR